MRPLALSAIVAPALLLGACTEASAPPASFTVRDSAGVRVVEHASLDTLPLRVAVDPPRVTIGSALGEEAQQLDRVMAGSVLSDGRIVLLNSGTSEVRFYDAAGALVATQGGPGEGPGEYRAPFFMFGMLGDSLLVWDVALRRGTVLAPDAAAVRTFTLDGGGLTLPGGVFRTGDLLVVQRIPGFDPTRITATALERSLDHLHSGEGGWLAELGERGGRTVMLYRGSIPLTGAPDPREGFNVGDVPFGASTQRAVAGDGYWVGDQTTREVRFRDRSGGPRTIVRWQGPPLAVTDADRRAYVEARIAAARDEEIKVALRQVDLGAWRFPTSFPSHGPLLVAADGALWMEDFRRPTDTGPARWTVFAPDGVAHERAELPQGSTLLWASDERVLLRLDDELGVQRVELRVLEAPASGR